MSFREDVTSKDRLVALHAIRDQITDDLVLCESMRDKAALYQRLLDVLAKIEAMGKQTRKGDDVDEIADRRTARRTGTAKN